MFDNNLKITLIKGPLICIPSRFRTARTPEVSPWGGHLTRQLGPGGSDLTAHTFQPPDPVSEQDSVTVAKRVKTPIAAELTLLIPCIVWT